MGKFWFILVKGLVVIVLLWSLILLGATGAGVNWGTQASHPLPAATVVRMLKDNGFQKVKLFDADSRTLKALSNSGIEVMVGIPNDMLSTFAISPQAAQNWVARNISSHSGVNIRYVAVGNEPFLSTYNGSFMNTTFPALQNIHSALTQAGLSSQVKVTIPLNADVYESSTSYPSGGDFRPDMHDLMLAIVQFLSDNGSPITVNIYPFISLYKDPSFPLDYAFFDGYSSPINDGGIIYENVFDANYDTLVAALTKNGYGNMSIIVGEIGWPTDGDQNANPTYARRFNQGFLSRVSAGKGTPLRPGPTDAYLFSLIDEDAKSTQPGNFERHWGIFYFDGTLKYQLNMGTETSNGGNLVAARDVHYLGKQWCVMSGTASLDDPQVGPSVTYACSMADCTSLGYGSSCGNLDARGNFSYAFNDYYQMNNQLQSACGFPDNLSVITTQDPSMGNCSFRIMIQPDTAASGVEGGARLLQKCVSLVIFVATFLFINF